MTDRIVLAVDGGAASRAVIRWAIHHIGTSDSMVDLVSVLERDVTDDATVMAHLRPLAEEVLVRAAVTLRTMLPAARISTSLLEGDAAHEFLQLSMRATMVVVGTNRSAASAHRTIGTLSGQIAARSQCVCVVVPASWVPGIGPVVVGTASDRAGESAVDFAIAAARHTSSRLLMLHAWQLPGVGWPLNILPIVMALTMLWQMALSPKSGDPMQQKIFMFMPVIFIAFCYNYASALALYWTVQNLFSVVQLYATRNQDAPTLQKVAALPKKK